jgi:muramoyltetrapeptide carboxypeptidase
VAPSGSANGPDRVEASVRALESFGFRVKASPHCADAYGYLAGDDATRARELELAFLDPDTAGVICLKGGYGTPRILDKIDYGIIASNPKLFLGYSDITALHIAFREMAGLVTFHGPMPSSDMVPEFDPESRTSLETLLFKMGTLPAHIANPKNRPFRTIAEGICEGELTGGNLSLLAATMGTPWEIDTEGKIIFVEDIDESPYRIDRMLNQLRLAGKFEACAGILIGSWTRCAAPDGKRSLTIEEIIRDLIVPCGKPILEGLEAGHCVPALTLPVGIRYRMNASAGVLEMLESPFAD